MKCELQSVGADLVSCPQRTVEFQVSGFNPTRDSSTEGCTSDAPKSLVINGVSFSGSMPIF